MYARPKVASHISPTENRKTISEQRAYAKRVHSHPHNHTNAHAIVGGSVEGGQKMYNGVGPARTHTLEHNGINGSLHAVRQV